MEFDGLPLDFTILELELWNCLQKSDNCVAVKLYHVYVVLFTDMHCSSTRRRMRMMRTNCWSRWRWKEARRRRRPPRAKRPACLRRKAAPRFPRPRRSPAMSVENLQARDRRWPERKSRPPRPREEQQQRRRRWRLERMAASGPSLALLVWRTSSKSVLRVPRSLSVDVRRERPMISRMESVLLVTDNTVSRH